VSVSLAAVLDLLMRKGLSCCVIISDEIITAVCHQWSGDASHFLLLSCGHVPLCLLLVQPDCWTLVLGGEDLYSVF
jgi:hypothetical protein